VSAIPQASERAVLGSMLLYGDEVQGPVSDVLDAADFGREAHGLLFTLLARRREQGRTVSVHGYADWLLSLPEAEVERLGGFGYVGDLVDVGCSPYFVRHLAHEVRLASLRRQVQALGARLTEEDDELAQQLEQAREELRLVQARLSEQTLTGTDTLASSVLAAIEQRTEQGGPAGQPWGFAARDRVLAARQPGQLVILAARPAMGKTALACCLALHALEHGEGVAYLSLEMGEREVAERLLAAHARVSATAMRDGRCTERDLRRLAASAEWLSTRRFQVLDAPQLEPAGISAAGRKAQARDAEFSLLILDYLQLVKGSSGRSNRQEEVSEISRACKLAAKELGVTVLALSQLNRAVESREGGRPRLADLRDSGSLEQDADAVIFIHRPEIYTQGSRPGEADMIVAKQRSGATGAATLAWVADHVRFEDIERRYDGGSTWTD